VAFDGQGRFRFSDKLTEESERDGKFAFKAIQVPIEAGYSYDIWQRSAQIDSLLKLYDPQGKLVALDDDSGGNLDARILFDAKEAGSYRLVATTYKEQLGAFSVEIVKFKLPAPRASNQALKTNIRTQD